MIIIVVFISFLLGFFIQLVALPFILEHLVKGIWTYIKDVSSFSIFRWSVSIIVSCAFCAIILQNQQERIQKRADLHYQHVVDSLKSELSIRCNVK